MKRITNYLFNFDKIFIWLGLASLFFGLMPLGIYVWGRCAGIIPNEEQWGLLGYNHGPWNGNEWISFFILIPMFTSMIFCLVTMPICIYRSGMNHRLTFMFILHGLVLNFVQVIFFFAHLSIVYWAID